MTTIQVAPSKELRQLIENFCIERHVDPEDIIWCPICKKFTVVEYHLRATGIERECYDGHSIP